MQSFTKAPDQIWFHGHVHTMDDNLAEATAFAVTNGLIAFIGSDESVLTAADAKTELHDLAGNWVVPGFIEGHMHLSFYGYSLLKLSIRDCSKAEILAAVASTARSLSPGVWIEGGMGWNNEVWDVPTYPTKEELDVVAPHNPVLLPRMDGHLVWVNSAAFAACGVTDDTPNPPHGEFMRTASGHLQGCASNAASEILKKCIPTPDNATHKKALLAAQEQLLRYGITSVNDMSTSLQDVDCLKELYEQGKYHLRFYGAVRGMLGAEQTPRQRAYLDQCPEVDLYDGHYTMRACKILGDGSVGAQSAALLEDFSDRPGHRGMLMQTDAELYDMVEEAALREMQVIVHAIGDATINQVLRVYEQVLQKHPNPDHRWHIEHFQLVTGNSCQRAKKLGVAVSMQPMHAPNSASMALRRLGADRAIRAYAGGLVLREMGHVAWGSDAPVATPSPLSGMHAAITRTNDKLEPKGGFFPENAVTPLQALLGYTRWGAWAQFTEAEKGSITPGKYADFTVLDADVLALGQHNPDRLLQVRVLQTIIGGKIVYNAAQKLHE